MFIQEAVRTKLGSAASTEFFTIVHGFSWLFWHTTGCRYLLADDQKARPGYIDSGMIGGAAPLSSLLLFPVGVYLKSSYH